MAELPCWRWAQVPAVTGGGTAVFPSPHLTHIQAELRRLQGSIMAGVSQGWQGNRGEQAHTGRSGLHPPGAGREQRLGVSLDRPAGSPRLALPT